jgi:hypothetical protein
MLALSDWNIFLYQVPPPSDGAGRQFPPRISSETDCRRWPVSIISAPFHSRPGLHLGCRETARVDRGRGPSWPYWQIRPGLNRIPLHSLEGPRHSAAVTAGVRIVCAGRSLGLAGGLRLALREAHSCLEQVARLPGPATHWSLATTPQYFITPPWRGDGLCLSQAQGQNCTGRSSASCHSP